MRFGGSWTRLRWLAEKQLKPISRKEKLQGDGDSGSNPADGDESTGISSHEVAQLGLCLDGLCRVHMIRRHKELVVVSQGFGHRDGVGVGVELYGWVMGTCRVRHEDIIVIAREIKKILMDTSTRLGHGHVGKWKLE